MSRLNSVPVNVQQMIESVQSKATPQHVKFNQVQVLEAIRDCCDQAVKGWNKEQEKQLLFKKPR